MELMRPDMVEIESSSSIKAVGFDGRDGLFVRLRDGDGLYRYSGVSEATFMSLRTAESPGRFYNEQIRDRFDWEKLEVN